MAESGLSHFMRLHPCAMVILVPNPNFQNLKKIQINVQSAYKLLLTVVARAVRKSRSVLTKVRVRGVCVGCVPDEDANMHLHKWSFNWSTLADLWREPVLSDAQVKKLVQDKPWLSRRR